MPAIDTSKLPSLSANQSASSTQAVQGSSQSAPVAASSAVTPVGAPTKANRDTPFKSALQTAQQAQTQARQKPAAAAAAGQQVVVAEAQGTLVKTGGAKQPAGAAAKGTAKTSTKTSAKVAPQASTDTTDEVVDEKDEVESKPVSADEAEGEPIAGAKPVVVNNQPKQVATQAAATAAAGEAVAAAQKNLAPAATGQVKVKTPVAAKGKTTSDSVQKKDAPAKADNSAEAPAPAQAAAVPVAAVPTAQPQAVAPVAEKTDQEGKSDTSRRQFNGAQQTGAQTAGSPQVAAGKLKTADAKAKATASEPAGATTSLDLAAEAGQDVPSAALVASAVIDPTAAAVAVAATQSAIVAPVAAATGHAAVAAVSPQAAFAAANHQPIVMGIQGKLMPDGGTMQIRLAPPELGEVQVNVQVSAGSVAASFQTSNETATRLLSHSLGDLRNSLEAAGVAVEKLQVSQAPKSSSEQSTDSRGNPGKSSGDQTQPDGQAPARDEQRRQLLRRMWKRVGGEPLDLVA